MGPRPWHQAACCRCSFHLYEKARSEKYMIKLPATHTRQKKCQCCWCEYPKKPCKGIIHTCKEKYILHSKPYLASAFQQVYTSQEPCRCSSYQKATCKIPRPTSRPPLTPPHTPAHPPAHSPHPLDKNRRPVPSQTQSPLSHHWKITTGKLLIHRHHGHITGHCHHQCSSLSVTLQPCCIQQVKGHNRKQPGAWGGTPFFC